MEKPDYIDAANTAVVATWPNTHYLDHLAPLASLFNVPLISLDQEILSFAKKYYPDVETIQIASLAEISKNYDTLIVTSKMWRLEMGGLIELLTGKKMHFVYCPHGNSDKGHKNPDLYPFHCQDNILIYGRQMEEELEKRGLSGGHYVGNYRLSYAQKHKDFYQGITKHFDSDRRTLLYAPTWEDCENSSSIEALATPLFAELPDSWNLIVKLHPFLLESHFSLITHLEEKYREKKNIHILKHFPPVFPVLQHCDGYIGDFSSVGYDFLYFNRPMFFFDTPKNFPDRGKLLYKAGVELPRSSLYQFIDEHWEQRNLTRIRRDLYNHAFF